MKSSESNIIITHAIQSFSCKFIAQQCGIALDKSVHLLLRQQVIGNALNFLRRAAVEGGYGGGIADLGRNLFNIFFCHMLKFPRMGKEGFPAFPENVCLPCVLHIFNKRVNLFRFDARQIVAYADIELEPVHTSQPVFFCQKGQQKPCLDILFLSLGHI